MVSCCKRVGAFFLLFLMSSASAFGATYTVTEALNCGPGTIVDAVAKANANPGRDLIEFAPGITEIRFDTCEGSSLDDSSDKYVLWISESLDIVGPEDVEPNKAGDQKLTINGRQIWFSAMGTLNPSECPSSDIFTGVVARQSPGLFRVGTPNADNSHISLDVKNLKVTQMNSFALVFDGATLSVTDSDLVHNTDSIWCTSALIRLRDNGTLNLDGALVAYNRFLSGDAQWVDAVVLLTSPNTTTTIRDSIFERNWGQGAIEIGDSSKLTIVNSLFSETGGILALESDVVIVNSAFSSFANDLAYWEGVWGLGGTFDARASTFSLTGWDRPDPPHALPPSAEKASVLRFIGDADVRLDGTVVRTVFFETQTLPLVYMAPSASLTVNESYCSDGSLPGATAAPPFGILRDLPYLPWAITPLHGGPLLDQIDNAASPLLDPLTGAPITVDVYGNPRVDGTGRDIGAVELIECAGHPDCSVLSDECNVGVCSPVTGLCELDSTAHEGGACDDGLHCTTGATCTAGICGGGSALDCSHTGDDCNTGVCNEATDTCHPVQKADGTACEDGHYCSVEDSCQTGVCTMGVPRDCSAESDEDNTGQCNETLDVCEQVPNAAVPTPPVPKPGSDGCGCRVAGAGPPGGAIVGGGLALMWWWRRRRSQGATGRV